ncbi:Hypothetical predicted protein [Xyrichtys novacula]|uniref:Uncharacterized protein n=1 Tax=Xyrichtys novacula TaxID=13765 RepID=A0AAV1GYR6_XYRNO|nr:Hypothetical predicted protein [Xyrichtys novacula]
MLRHSNRLDAERGRLYNAETLHRLQGSLQIMQTDGQTDTDKEKSLMRKRADKNRGSTSLLSSTLLLHCHSEKIPLQKEIHLSRAAETC